MLKRVVVVVFCVACAAQTPGRGGGADGDLSGSDPADGAPAAGETGAQCADGIDNDNSGVADCDDPSCTGAAVCATGPADAGSPSVPMNMPMDSCEAINVMAETGFKPVDIILVVDSSSSMDDEERLVRENLNTFASTLAASGIDYHVVGIGGVGSIPPPLGGSDRLRTVRGGVGSEAGLKAVIDRWNMYRDFLREDAVTHTVHVTDDDSHDYPWMRFKSQLESRLGHEFTAHAIVSPPGSGNDCFRPFGDVILAGGCNGPYGQADCNGQEYWSVAADTGGTQHSICSADWSAVFAELVESIAVPVAVPCELLIPEPPEGMVFARDRVNVELTPGGGTPLTIPKVSSGAACPPGALGWHYDDDANPTKIVLCEDTCTSVSSDAFANLSIALGCDTILL